MFPALVCFINGLVCKAYARNSIGANPRFCPELDTKPIAPNEPAGAGFQAGRISQGHQKLGRLRVFSGLSLRTVRNVEWHSTCFSEWARQSTMCALGNLAAALPLPRSVKSIISEGGGEYVGIQRGVPQAGSPDLVLFNDPLTGTTLTLIASAAFVTVEHVRAKLAESRSMFAAMRKSEAYGESRQRELPWEGSWSREAMYANHPV